MRRRPRRARLRIAGLTTALVLVAIGIMTAATAIAARFIPDYTFPTVTAAGGQPATTLPGNAAPAGSSGAAIVLSSPSDVFAFLLVVGAVAFVIMGLLSAVVSWFIAGRVLTPVRVLTDAAHRAAQGNYDHRISLENLDEEFVGLIGTFNEMLERTERALAAQRRFAGNAAHELMTPLATSKTLLEVGAPDDDPSATGTLLSKLASANERSIQIVDALLELSDISTMALVNDTVNFESVVLSEADVVRALPSAATLLFTVSTVPVVLTGHTQLLRQLVGNLLRNAVQHNTPSGHVRITLRYLDGATPTPTSGCPASARLIVENSGALIDDDTVAALTEPFYRAAGRVARSRDRSDRHGLGLSIAAAIIDAHGGALQLAPSPTGGLVCVVDLPATAKTPSEIGS